MRITSSAVVARPANDLFALSQDYRRRLEWDTYLSEAFLVGQADSAAVGVESYCKSRSGAVMVSTYISYSPPTHAAVEMVSGPRILRRFSGTWRFRQLGPAASEVKFIYNFELRPRLIAWAFQPLVGALYRRSMDRRLQAFKAWAENGA
ncbi:type II toxin-antitoxin system RatA family toxin [Luteimonas lutimaris]|uniref:SRPBCC family protein n=1 Tax=Luteimonas lutimaris TaxID=698645 RepID=A0ABP7MQN7_9GAMM